MRFVGSLLPLLLLLPSYVFAWPKPAFPDPEAGDHIEIILTFDDGPSAQFTPQILDELKKHNIKAIFFWVGNRLIGDSKRVQKRRQILRTAVAQGHVVANHTMSHANLCRVSKKQAQTELDKTQTLLANLTGMDIPWFRTPYGADCLRLRSMLTVRNLQHIHWDIDPQEWKYHDSGHTFRQVKHQLRSLKGRRMVLLMHDTHAVSVRGLRGIVSWVKSENVRRTTKQLPLLRFGSPHTIAKQLVTPATKRELVEEVVFPLSQLSNVRRLIP